ncbi:MAG: DUF134 domain-containing protein [Prolixibacteraceae bacterium]|nr:DUF134 domain-containing protein [Prolixibacteraceae bacterium]MBN2650030.1 DUF134 domain-containing protein [Prolixibacteraceae bacterium]
MPNRIRNRRISQLPPMEGYKPFGVPMRDLESVIMFYEEYEAIRLADYEDLSQLEAAERMNISRPTFTRLYDKARKKISKAFVEGKAIIIKGGTYETDDYWYKCDDCKETISALKPLTQCRNCESGNITLLNEQQRGHKGRGRMRNQKK